MRAVLINVGIGNIDSVERALQFLSVPHDTISSPEGLQGATHVVLPGVGAFRAGMQALHSHGMVEPLREVARQRSARLFGVCLGMQLLGERSEEGGCEGLGVLPFRVEKLEADPARGIKVPHVGFATVRDYAATGLFEGLHESSDFYFTHSYALKSLPVEANKAIATHGETFVAAFDAGAVCGAQFHPEKSQSNGLRLLGNFFRI